MARVSDRDGKPRPEADPGANGVAARVDVAGIIDEKERHWNGKLQRPTAEVAVAKQGQGYTGTDPFSVDFPALVAFLRDVTFSDGSRRTPGSVVLFVQDGMFTTCLTEKGSPELVAFQAARSPTEALQLAEEGLRAGTLPWRSPRRSGGRK